MTVVLIVEDDDDVRALVEISFELVPGWTSRSVPSAAAAIHELGVGGIDVVLSDRNLGDGSSDDLLDAAGEIPVVMLSASLTASETGHTKLPGYAGAIAKPFNPIELPQLVATLMCTADGRCQA